MPNLLGSALVDPKARSHLLGGVPDFAQADLARMKGPDLSAPLLDEIGHALRPRACDVLRYVSSLRLRLAQKANPSRYLGCASEETLGLLAELAEGRKRDFCVSLACLANVFRDSKLAREYVAATNDDFFHTTNDLLFFLTTIDPSLVSRKGVQWCRFVPFEYLRKNGTTLTFPATSRA